MGEVGRRFLRVGQVAQAQPAQLRRRVAEQAHQGRVGLEEFPLPRQQGHADTAVLEQQPKARLGFNQAPQGVAQR